MESFHFPSRDAALSHLDKSHSPIRTKDAVFLMFFAGLLSMIVFLIIVIICLPLQRAVQFKAVREFLASLYTFRFLMIPILVMLAAALCIKLFMKYKINYIFIMDLDPHRKITHIQLLRVAGLFFAIWGFCLMGQIFAIKFKTVFPH